MSRERLVAAVAAVLLALSLAYYLFSVPASVRPGKPTYHGAPLTRLVAELPQIGTFNSFNLENENPFIPWQERLLEQEPHSYTHNSTNFPPLAPPAVVVSEQYTPLPRLKGDKAPSPHCIGLVDTGDDNVLVLIVHMPGAPDDVLMKIGDHIDNWQLIGVDNANFARFLDPTGTATTLLIGQGDLADAQNLPIQPAPPKPKPEPKGKRNGKGNGNGNGNAKAPGTGGALLVPRMTDAPDAPATPTPGTQQPRRRRGGGGQPPGGLILPGGN